MKILLAIAIIPVFVILSYIYEKDIHKEDKAKLKKTIILGILSTIPILILEVLLGGLFPSELKSVTSYFQLFINVFIGIALIEEGAKYLIVRLFNYNKSHFDESFDAIVYCTYASLGFAVIENVLYVIGSLLSSGSLSSMVTAILRAFTSIPGHACFGIFMGYYFAKAKTAQFNNDSNEKKYLILALAVATTLHTLFDFLILTKNGYYMMLWLVFIIACDIVAIKLIKNLSKQNVVFNEKLVELDVTRRKNDENTNYSGFQPYTITNAENNGFKMNNLETKDSIDSSDNPIK